MSVLTSQRVMPLRGLSFVLPVCRRRIISLEMVILDTLKWSATVILTESWHRRSYENSNFQNGNFLLTAQLMTAGDLNSQIDHRKLDHGTEN